jgi:hypothetical protein
VAALRSDPMAIAPSGRASGPFGAADDRRHSSE